MRTVIEEDLKDVINRMERNHPELKRASVSHIKTLEQRFGKEKAEQIKRTSCRMLGEKY